MSASNEEALVAKGTSELVMLQKATDVAWLHCRDMQLNKTD